MKKTIASVVIGALALVGGFGLAPAHAAAEFDGPMPIGNGDCEGGTVYWWGICSDSADGLPAMSAVGVPEDEAASAHASSDAKPLEAREPRG